MDVSPAILVIDDELDNFDVIEALLMPEGYQLYYAPNGTAGLAFLKTTKPDTILLDVMMPDMDGIEVCQRIRANPDWCHIPIIIVTALIAKEDLARCLEAGADDFISKPVNRIELRARLRSALRIKGQYDELQAMLGLREDMVNMIVHDLRNPLASIILATDLLQSSGLANDRQQKKVDQIAHAGRQLQSQVETLLLMARLESGKMVLDYAEVDLVELCREALADVEMFAGQKHLTIVEVLPELGRYVTLDASVFRRILDNLLSNAIKFSPSNSQIVFQVDYLEMGGFTVQVIDAGPGVSEECKQIIFEKYEIGTFMKGVAQTGLGLAFCKMAIAAHGGKITVKPAPSRGAIFTIDMT